MIPGYSLNKVADDVQKKNTSAPYLTKFTQKALQPAEDVRKGVFGGLYINGSAIPADFANQRAGDPTYTETQLKQVMDYINNPANGWVKQEDGTYKNHNTGGMYNSERARLSTVYPVEYYVAQNVEPRYRTGYRKAVVPSEHSLVPQEDPELLPDVDRQYIKMFNQKASDPIHPDSSSYTVLSEKPLARDQREKYYPPLSASHEFNHGYTSLIVSGGLIKPYWMVKYPGIDISPPYNSSYTRSSNYAKSVVELINAASLFQQQHKRNTGRRIVDKNKFWEDFNNAKKNIQDYDPESRRFMQSIDILQNEAPNDPEAAYMLKQIQEAMPLITRNRKHTIPGYTYNPAVVG